LTDDFSDATEVVSHPVLLYVQQDSKAKTLSVAPKRNTLNFSASAAPKEVESALLAPGLKADGAGLSITAYAPPGLVVKSGVGMCPKSPCRLVVALDESHETVFPKVQQMVVALGRSDVPGFVSPVTIGVQLPASNPQPLGSGTQLLAPQAPPPPVQ